MQWYSNPAALARDHCTSAAVSEARQGRLHNLNYKYMPRKAKRDAVGEGVGPEGDGDREGE